MVTTVTVAARCRARRGVVTNLAAVATHVASWRPRCTRSCPRGFAVFAALTQANDAAEVRFAAGRMTAAAARAAATTVVEDQVANARWRWYRGTGLTSASTSSARLDTRPGTRTGSGAGVGSTCVSVVIE